LRTVLPANPDLNCLSRFGGVGITPASEKGHVEIVRELLLRTDINVNHTNFVGWTPFLEAIVLNDGGAKQQEIVKLLLDHGANPHMTDKYGKTPLELARERVPRNCRAADCGRSLTEERHYRYAITAMRTGANRRQRVSHFPGTGRLNRFFPRGKPVDT
jgi:hypothetical protein